MPYLSAHAVIQIGERFLLNKEHEDFGYLLLGGRFADYNFNDLVYGEEKASEWVVLRELEEELNVKPENINLRLQKYLGWKPDDIRTKSGKTYHVDKMYFWGASMDSKIKLEELQTNTKIPLRLMSVSEVQNEVFSPAMREIVQEVYSQK